MRWLSLLIAVLLSSCVARERSTGATHYSTPILFANPSLPSSAPPTLNRAADGSEEEPEQGAKPIPVPEVAQPILPAAVQRSTAKGVDLILLAFDDRRYTLAVADKAGGPATQWQTAGDVARAHRAVAAINASFFTPEGKPLGLVIENGKRFGSWNRRSSLTSGVLAVQGGRPSLSRRDQRHASSGAVHLVQAGPLLLDRGKVVSGLSASSARARSFLAFDGDHRWVVGAAESATLAALSAALATQPLPGVLLRTALNLDGGRSSDLWVSSSLQGGPVSTRRFLNKPVRNYILIKPRPAQP